MFGDPDQPTLFAPPLETVQPILTPVVETQTGLSTPAGPVDSTEARTDATFGE